jgi:starch-binding outer membrane protein, SusD/RagB family
MKKIIGLLAVVSVFLVSCKDEFIEVQPESTLTVGALYKTDKDFQDAVVGIYSGFRSPYSRFWQFSDLRADDVAHYWQGRTDLIRLDNFVMDVNDPVLVNSWRDYYNVIYAANMLLSHIETADAALIKNKELYTGEVKFLRALAYFDLVRIFGDVPLLTQPITIEESFRISREKADVIYNELIIPDLLEAENKLLVKYPGAEVGRATQGAAKALLGKVYLTRQEFGKAEAKLKEVTTLGYALVANFNDLFNYANEHHSEYIFDIEYIDGGLGLGSNFTSEFMVEFQTAGGPVVTALQNIYGIKVINSGSAGSPIAELIAAFEPNDRRKDITAAQGVTNQDGQYLPLAPTGIPSFTKKYMTSLTIQNDSRANWKVIRYADVLLMLAEALNENGKTGEALDYLKLVRERAGLAGYAGLTQAEAREKIYLERRLELFLEGHRWFDLVRTGRALEVMQSYGMKPHMTVFPIPQSQIEVVNNPAVFSQNPGY